jgi:hypothetical protein
MRIMALMSDLMDRSRVSAAIDAVEFVRDARACSTADVVIVDIARHGDAIAEVRAAAPAARLVAFGPHVDEAGLDRARADGADVVLVRSRFFADPAAVTHE